MIDFNKGLMSTGITVWCDSSGNKECGWAAKLDWLGKENQAEITGTISTRYFEETLEKAIDVVLAMASRLGVQFFDNGDITDSPYLYYKGDGDDEEFIPPNNWRQLLNDEARHRQWVSYRVDAYGFESFAKKTEDMS